MVSVTTLGPDEIAPALPDLARLRIDVFRDWPYLYDGDAEYEARYLAAYAASPGAIMVIARDGDAIVGAATGAPLGDHDAAFSAPLIAHGYDPSDVFYCAESVLLPAYRGQGLGHTFFNLREAHARALGHRISAFCAVIRPDDHPLRPATYRPLDPFWRARGYVKLSDAIAHYDWRDIGDGAESTKPMAIWTRRLSPPSN